MPNEEKQGILPDSKEHKELLSGLFVSTAPLNVVSNFSVKDVVYNEEDNTVYTPYDTSRFKEESKDINPCLTNHIQQYGYGLERHNIMVKALESISSLNDYRELLENLRFTQAYETLPEFETRYSDYVGDYGVPKGAYTCCQPKEDFVSIQEIFKDFYKIRKREERDELWETQNTNYSVVYDLDRLILYVSSQENYDDWEKINME